LRERLRVRLKRDPQPSAGMVDSQSLPPPEQARVLAIGDNAYPRGTRAQFANCYDNYRLTDGTPYDSSCPARRCPHASLRCGRGGLGDARRDGGAETRDTRMQPCLEGIPLIPPGRGREMNARVGSISGGQKRQSEQDHPVYFPTERGTKWRKTAATTGEDLGRSGR
jgi:hypothetical protein